MATNHQLRNQAVLDSLRSSRQVQWPQADGKPKYISEIYGCNVFGLKTLQQTLPKTVYSRFIQQIKVSCFFHSNLSFNHSFNQIFQSFKSFLISVSCSLPGQTADGSFHSWRYSTCCTHLGHGSRGYSFYSLVPAPGISFVYDLENNSFGIYSITRPALLPKSTILFWPSKPQLQTASRKPVQLMHFLDLNFFNPNLMHLLSQMEECVPHLRHVDIQSGTQHLRIIIFYIFGVFF